MALRQQHFLLQRYLQKALVDLPAMPASIIQILQATEREDVTLDQIEALVVADAAVTTKLLKVVNSAFFGLPRQVIDVGQALSILGLHQTRNMVLSLGVLNALQSPNARVLEMQREFWQYSFGSASCAREVATRKALARREQELAFIGGLLHDVGRLFLLTLFNQPYTQVVQEAVAKGEPLIDVESRVLGTTHAELGGTLAESWNFPEPLVSAIALHDGVASLRGERHFETLCCIHAADRLTADLLLGPEAAPLHPWDDVARQWIGFGDVDWELLREEMRVSIEKAAELMAVL